MKKLSFFLIVTFFSFNLFAYESVPKGPECDNAPKSTGQNESWVDGNRAATHVAILNPSVGAQDSSRARRISKPPGGNDRGAGGTSGGSGSGRGNVK